MRFVALVVVAALFGCTRDNPASCADGHCADPALPFCDVDGALGGSPNTCIAVSCMAGQFAGCRGDQEIVCNAAGDNYDLVDCPYGCSAAAGGCNACNTSDCEKHIIPKYLPTICDQLASDAALTISSSTTLDTSNDLACGAIVPQTNGPDICVLHYGVITIERNQTYTVSGSRVLALVADRDLVVDGILDISGSGLANGPGGGFLKSGTQLGAPGGGAGYRHPGGAGASNTVDGGAANGGPAGMNPSTLAQLLGGTQPANGQDGVAAPGAGGGVTAISCRGTVSVPGLIDAAGEGGAGGNKYITTYYFPSGGASGGTVALQGMHVNVTGELYANGGGGGAGGTLNAGGGGKGTRSLSPAPGGVATASGCGNGGAGGTNTSPAPGSFPPGGNNCGGAGGGSAGFFLVYVPQSEQPSITPLGVSPSVEPKGTLATN